MGVSLAVGQHLSLVAQDLATIATSDNEFKRVLLMKQQTMNDFTIQFPAIRGKQGDNKVFTTQVPFNYLVRMFKFNEEKVPAELRAQRELNPKRASAIADYILENRSNFTLPAITASVSEEMEFKSFDGFDHLGVLFVPIDSMILVNDGQHRRAAVEEVINIDPTLASETITVTFYLDKNLSDAQQRFSDINKNQVRPATALSLLYDVRNPYNQHIVNTLAKYPQIKTRIDMESNSVGKNSDKLWSLTGFSKFMDMVTGIKDKGFNKLSEEAKESGYNNLDTTLKALEALPMWSAMLNFNISAPAVRDGYVVGHTVFLHALGKVAATLIGENRSLEELNKVATIDVSKTASTWTDRCVVGGKMLKNAHGVNSTAAVILEHINNAASSEAA